MSRTANPPRRNLELRRRRALAPWAEGLEARQLLAGFTVTSAADSGPNTLRDAITQVNADVNDSPSAPDVISFDLPGEGQQTITLTSPLPVITNPVIIDGYSQPGSSTNHTLTGFNEAETDVAVLNVRLDAPGAVPTAQAPGLITVAAANTTIDGLAITRFNGPAIALLPPPNSPTGSVGDDIWGNFIGVPSFDPDSFNDLPLGPNSPLDPNLWTHVNPYGNAQGILVQSSNNRIGGTLPVDRNVIQGNHGDGVRLATATGTGNLVEGNFILDNDASGISVTTSNNLIGEAIGAGPAGGGNVISGNNYGVSIVGPAATGNILVNNEIGTEVGLENVLPPIRGMNPRPNRYDGVLIQDAPGNIVGGQISNSRNVIAANGRDGVSIQNVNTQAATGNVVQGNYIGYNLRGGVIALLPNRDGVNISSADNTIGGVTLAARNEIAANARNGVTISSMTLDSSNLNPVPIPNAQPTGNFIAGNYIGTEGGGDDYGNTLDGVLIEDAAGNSVGGTVAGASNVISGNNNGVVINDDTAGHQASTGNVVAGNNIGLMSDSTTPLPNSVDGVLVTNASGNTIGGPLAAAANILSGNNNGLHLSGAFATANLVAGNFVGTNSTGTAAARNAVDGILIDNGASANTIGGLTATTRNIISGNNTGVAITGAASTHNLLLGNYVGVAADGATALPNAVAGISVSAPGNTVGGTVAAAANVVSGNFVGIYLTGPDATGNTIEGNLVGTDATGDAAAHNTTDGVLIDNGATGNTIGGAVARAANIIAYNGGNGVDVLGVTGNSILSNRTFANSLLGIAGPNGLLSGYSLTSVASTNGSTTVIQGTLTSASQATFQLQFFINPAYASPGYNYEGETQIASVTVPSDGTAPTSFTVTVPSVLTAGQYVTFTGTGPDGTTSEFSAGVPVTSATQPLVYTVRNINDSGPDSLRAAIEAVNLAPSPLPTFNDKIVFDIPADGPQTINLLSPLPVIVNPVAIEGYTQRGSTINIPQVTTQVSQSSGSGGGSGTSSTTFSGTGLNSTTTTVSSTGTVTVSTTNASTFNAVINIRLDGSNASPGTDGQGLLTIASLNCQVSGLSITGYLYGPAILLKPAGAPNSGGIGDTIFGNLIGVPYYVPTNTSVTPQSSGSGNLAGIVVESSNNVIGGEVLNIGIPLPTPVASQGYANPPSDGANVIQGNNGPGIVFRGPWGTGNVVGANYILDNAQDGVLIDNTSNNFIGQAVAGLGNVISGNGWNGVDITGSEARGNVVVNNLIGTSPDGGTSRPNLQNGVLIQDAPGNTVGGLLPLSPNVIGSNAFDGVSIVNGAAQGAVGNVVEGNAIGFNPSLPQIPILPNRDGISISAANNTVGGTSLAAGNTIAFNWRNGVTIAATTLDAHNNPTAVNGYVNPNPTGNLVAGNRIGTIDGTADNGNTLDGVLIEDAGANTVGGTAAGARNVISGNNRGVVINDDTATHQAATANLIAGNYIGPMLDGVTVLNNATDGVRINNAADNTVGGTVAAAANVISGNNVGVHLTGGGTTGNVILGNYIGTDFQGIGPVRNANDGVLVDGDASGNTIGGLAAGAGNTIGYNIGAGVSVVSGNNDAILSNSIFANDRLGIDLVASGDPPSGVTPNQLVPSVGPNDLVNSPVIGFAASDGKQTSIQGTFLGASGGVYLIQLFSSPTADPSGHGQGKTYLGSVAVTLPGSNPSQFVSTGFDAELKVGLQSGQLVTATATEVNNSASPLYASTSEFSNAAATVAVQLGFSATSYAVDQTAGTATITVTRTGDPGATQGTTSVDYTVGGGTAVPGVNYLPVSGTLTFNPGDTARTITIPVVNDPAVAPSTTVNVTLSNPTGGATLGTGNPVTLTITNGNTPSVQFSVAGYQADESGGAVTITVTRNTGDGSASVRYSTSDGTAQAGVDYTAVSGTLNFSQGQTSQTFTVPVVDAHKVGGDVTLNLTLSDATGAGLGDPSTATLTINDNDLTGAFQFNNVSYGVNATASSALITVVRTGGSGGTVSIRYATGGGTAVPGQDYAPQSGTLTFNPGETAKTFSIPILNHALIGNVSVGLALSAPAGGATLGPVAAATLSIAQNATATPVKAGPTPGPVITSFTLQTGGPAVTGVTLTFNEALDAARAENPANYGYYILSAGADNLFGTRDDGSVLIASAHYNPATFQVVLTPVVPLSLGQLYKIGVNTQASVPLQTGLTDTSGNLLDGAYDGHSGTPYVAEFALGAQLRYADGSGNFVSLRLSRGGLLQLQLAGTGDAQALGIVGAVAGKSVLSGTVRGPRRAFTTIPVIQGAAGVRVRLRPPAFHIGHISAAAVDHLLARRKGR